MILDPFKDNTVNLLVGGKLLENYKASYDEGNYNVIPEHARTYHEDKPVELS